MLPILLVVLLLALLYWLPLRHRMNRWGATSTDLSRTMAGDSLLADWTYSGTMAVTIDAPPAEVWPWLVQIGYQRGGLYSYDWLDRLFGYLDRPSATRIVPEFQSLAVGDRIPLGRGPSWPVAVVDPPRALVLDMRNLGGFDWVWQFGLYPVDATRTRLVSRSRVRTRTVGARLGTYAIEPAGFVMTRRMLLGIKQRAEALRRRLTSGDASGGWRPSARGPHEEHRLLRIAGSKGDAPRKPAWILLCSEHGRTTNPIGAEAAVPAAEATEAGH